VATPAEILALEQAHRAAQARLGLAAAFVALVEWENVQPLNAASTSSDWLVKSLLVITAIRKMSRKLAISYYQLARAVETGRTLGVPEGSTPDNVTLGTLRKNFRDNVIDVAALPSTRTRSDDPDIQWFEEALRAADESSRSIRMPDLRVDPLIQKLLDVEGTNDTSPVEIDKYEWEDPMTFEEVDRTYRRLLRQQAVEHTIASVELIRANEDLSPSLALEQIEASHAASASLGSGSVDMAGIDAGREAIDAAVRSDTLVKLVARGTGPDPCAFCAMLASRGFVFTGATSGVGANADQSVGEEIKKYHIHCKCYPIVRWVHASTLPELNAYFKEKWTDVTDGFHGNEARKKWRRWIYAQRKANPDAPHGVPINP
jgi:hypothetical protein